jgi:hypothetical protein
MPTSQKLPLLVDKISGRVRVRSYDVRTASQQYANIAGLLAGFAFTAVILIAQENKPTLSDVEVLRRNIAAVGFFVSFFGCILNSFVFAIISGEEELTPRVNQMAFFVAASFSLSITLLFWSIALILKAFLVEEVAAISYKIFPLSIMIHPIYVISSVLDSIYIFECRKPRLYEYLVAIVPSLVPILIAFMLRMGKLTINAELNLNAFYSIIWCFITMIILGNVASAASSTLNEDFRLNIKLSGFWVCLHTVLISYLIILI